MFGVGNPALLERNSGIDISYRDPYVQLRTGIK